MLSYLYIIIRAIGMPLCSEVREGSIHCVPSSSLNNPSAVSIMLVRVGEIRWLNDTTVCSQTIVTACEKRRNYFIFSLLTHSFIYYFIICLYTYLSLYLFTHSFFSSFIYSFIISLICYLFIAKHIYHAEDQALY